MPHQVAPTFAPAPGARRRAMRFNASRVVPARPRAPTMPTVFLLIGSSIIAQPISVAGRVAQCATQRAIASKPSSPYQNTFQRSCLQQPSDSA